MYFMSAVKHILYRSTNNRAEKVDFETALLRGLAPDYGLYMIDRADMPKLKPEAIGAMRSEPYGRIAFEVLAPYLGAEIPGRDLAGLLDDAYGEDVIPTDVQRVTENLSLMWLTKGPTYSFKDYAARFFGRILNYFLERRRLRRVVVVATSGDTGGAVADALLGLSNIDNVVFFPKGAVSEGQRRQMTTLGGNVHAFEVNGDFDACQALAKRLLVDGPFAERTFGDRERFTSANSISIGRLLPQAVYPFFAYARIADGLGPLIASVPCGNFGDMMGTVIAKEMGLPISRIICGVNENREFPDFLYGGAYRVTASKRSPSSAMIVSHPSNLARLVDFYGGCMRDERDPATGSVTRPGVIEKMPDMEEMRRDLFSLSVDNPQHYRTMKEVFEKHAVILDPHGAVGWRAFELYRSLRRRDRGGRLRDGGPREVPRRRCAGHRHRAGPASGHEEAKTPAGAHLRSSRTARRRPGGRSERKNRGHLRGSGEIIPVP